MGAIIWNAESNDNNAMVFKHVGHMNKYQGAEVVHCASWIKSDDARSVVSTSSMKPFFWSSSGSTINSSNTNSSKKNKDDDKGGIMDIWTPNSLLKMSKEQILQHMKEQDNDKT